jgi:hypothetical protein
VLFDIDVSSVDGVTANTPGYGGLYRSYRLSFIISRYSKTRACTSTAANEAQDVCIRFAGCLVKAAD